MSCPKQISLYFNSNIERYQVTVYDGCNQIVKRVYARQDCLCVPTFSNCLRIVASPAVEGYSTKLYFWITTTCQKVFSLYFNFPQTVTPTPQPAVNTFTLTDANYNLPIDGTLFFTQA